MSGEVLRDLRAKITPHADQVLAAVSMARGCDKQDLVRQILDEWADRVLHESTLVVRLAGREGKSGNHSE